MGVLLITMFLAVLCWTIIGLKEDKQDSLAAGSLIFGVLSSVTTLVMIATATSQNHDFTHYKTVKWNTGKIQKIHVNDLETIQAAVAWNHAIEKHKKNRDSIWVGIWYSSELAALEPIKLPSNGD